MLRVSAGSRRSAGCAAAVLVLAAALLAGCETLAISALGFGASAGISHTVSGTAYRTFTAPEDRVKIATFAALKRMGSTVESSEKIEKGELIKASMAERQIEIELETLSDTVTHMRATAKRGFMRYDAATATEIIAQTEKSMDAASSASN